MAAQRPSLFSKRPDFVLPELHLGSLKSSFIQTWYKYETYIGADARHFLFDLRSKMAAQWPSLFSKQPDFFRLELDL